MGGYYYYNQKKSIDGKWIDKQTKLFFFKKKLFPPSSGQHYQTSTKNILFKNFFFLQQFFFKKKEATITKKMTNGLLAVMPFMQYLNYINIEGVNDYNERYSDAFNINNNYAGDNCVITMGCNNKVLLISHIAIKEQYQRQGWFTKFIERIIAYCKNKRFDFTQIRLMNPEPTSIQWSKKFNTNHPPHQFFHDSEQSGHLVLDLVEDKSAIETWWLADDDARFQKLIEQAKQKQV